MFKLNLTLEDVFTDVKPVTEDQIAASFATKLEGALPTHKHEGAVRLPTKYAVAGAYLLHEKDIPFTRCIDKEGNTDLVVWACDVEKIVVKP